MPISYILYTRHASEIVQISRIHTRIVLDIRWIDDKLLGLPHLCSVRVSSSDITSLRSASYVSLHVPLCISTSSKLDVCLAPNLLVHQCMLWSYRWVKSKNRRESIGVHVGSEIPVDDGRSWETDVDVHLAGMSEARSIHVQWLLLVWANGQSSFHPLGIERRHRVLGDIVPVGCVTEEFGLQIECDSRVE